MSAQIGLVRRQILRARTVTQARLWGLAFMLMGFFAFLAGHAFIIWIGLTAFAEGYFPLVEFLVFAVPIAFVFALSWSCLIVCDFFRQRLHDIQAQSLWSRIDSDSKSIPKYVLYLRSFDSTGAIVETELLESKSSDGTTRVQKRTYELETQLADAVGDLCPFVALGKSLEHIGAGRIEVGDENWKAAISKLMERARLIIMVPVVNPGTMWELDQVIERGWVSKTLFINIPERQKWLWFGSKFQQSDDWPFVQKKLNEAGFTLPAFANSGRFIFFGPRPDKPKKRRLDITSKGHLKRTLWATRTLN